MKPIDDPKFAEAARHYRDAVESSKRHSALAESSLQKYGDHGPLISGVVRDHFPQHIKEELRTLARDVTAHGNLADAARPRGVRNSTMRRLAQQVAGRYGSGFYGPQPGAYKKNPSRRKNPTGAELHSIVESLDRASRAELEMNLKQATEHASDMSLPASKRRVWKETAALIRKQLKGFAPKRRENPRGAPVDEAAAWELHLYAENSLPPGSPDPYKKMAANQKESIIKNLAKKLRKGVYDKKLAAKLWTYYAESAAKLYSKDFSTGSDWPTMFSVATRRRAGEHLEEANREQVEEAAELGLVGAKQNPRSRKPKGRAVVLKGDKLWVSLAMANAGIPFIFIEEAGPNVVGSVPTQFIDKLRDFLSANPQFEGRFAGHSTQVAAEKRFAMQRKKRRTPAQIAATKKLVAMNKKRRAGKSAKRQKNPRGKSGLFYRVFVAEKEGGKWRVYYVANISGRYYALRPRRDSMELTREQALRVVKNPGFGGLKYPPNSIVGVVSSDVTSAQIIAKISKGKA